jgi:oligopeptide transport system permease protein
VRNLNVKYGLDDPLYKQYGTFLLNALKGDIGISFQRQDKPVRDILAQGFKVTAVLGALAVVFAVAVGVSLGVLAATHRNGVADYASLTLASVGSAIPSFALGIFLIYLFAVKLQVLPVYGWGSPKQTILPLVTLAALPTALLARMTRASLLEVLRQDYIRTARAKGLRTSTVLYKHALRNALIPILTAVGPITAHLVTGSFIVEQIYSIPGTGRLVVQSINARDYGMIMGSTLFYASIICVANLVVDITYAVVDPRIRLR